MWDSLEASHRDASNEYPQHMFSQKNKKTIIFLGLIVLVSTGSKLIFVLFTEWVCLEAWIH